MGRLVKAVVIVLLLEVGGLYLAAVNWNPSAVNDPGGTEVYLATKAKHWLIGGRARSGIPPALPRSDSNVKEGQDLYGTECALCHGLNGHTPTDTGRWMYPRTADLTSAAVQQYGDAELFWIIKNGIRLTGMPAFARVEPDENIWRLVFYVRKLGGTQGPAPAPTPVPKS